MRLHRMQWSASARNHHAAQQYFGGEMVGVTVKEHTCGECAARIALTVPFGIFQEIEIKHLGIIEMQVAGTGVILEQRAAERFQELL